MKFRPAPPEPKLSNEQRDQVFLAEQQIEFGYIRLAPDGYPEALKTGGLQDENNYQVVARAVGEWVPFDIKTGKELYDG